MVAVSNLSLNTSEDKIYCHTGGKARWVGFCVGVGLADALCPTGVMCRKARHSLLKWSPRHFSALSLLANRLGHNWGGEWGEYVVWSVEECDMY